MKHLTTNPAFFSNTSGTVEKHSVDNCRQKVLFLPYFLFFTSVKMIKNDKDLLDANAIKVGRHFTVSQCVLAERGQRFYLASS